MKARNLNLLAAGLCAALAAPLASAQLVDRNVGVRASAAAQLPTRAADRAVDRTMDRTRDQVDRVRDRVERQDAVDAEVHATTNAAAHSDVAQREYWARVDVDADGRISLDEAAADEMLVDMFEAVDTDGDGFVSDAEYRAHAHAGHVADASAQGAAQAAAHSTAAMRGVWSVLDGDGDGRISALEAQADAAFSASFGTMDADGDGFVSDAEYRDSAKEDRDPQR